MTYTVRWTNWPPTVARHTGSKWSSQNERDLNDLRDKHNLFEDITLQQQDKAKRMKIQQKILRQKQQLSLRLPENKK